MITLQGQKSRIIDYDEKLPVTRDTKALVNGKNMVVRSETLTILCNVQPVEGRDLLLVPEFDRFKEQYFVFTDTPMLINDKVTRTDATTGRPANFVVQKVETWGSFYECRMMRIDTGPNATP